ncbi:hypothetical protein L208DRAFT_1345764 [Tricholoma matsutake]|nr:hypothetical protein L208DRAFT_1345764 [Tricholoma matsutake 945]
MAGLSSTTKVGHVTCDNASNNPTMMKESAVQLKTTMGKKYNWRKRKINCLAHVINLAMQMLISTYSKSPHFNPKQPDAHVPTSHDEVGLVRAIVVKECSSSKQKEMWRTIQVKANNGHPAQLILDMKLHWEEQDSVKCDKIRELKLTSEEWLRVNTFLGLLSVCLLFHLQIKA